MSPKIAKILFFSCASDRIIMINTIQKYVFYGVKHLLAVVIEYIVTVFLLNNTMQNFSFYWKCFHLKAVTTFGTVDFHAPVEYFYSIFSLKILQLSMRILSFLALLWDLKVESTGAFPNRPIFERTHAHTPVMCYNHPSFKTHLHILAHISSREQSSNWVSAQPPSPSAGMLTLNAFRSLQWEEN